MRNNEELMNLLFQWKLTHSFMDEDSPEELYNYYDCLEDKITKKVYNLLIDKNETFNK